MFDKTAPTFGDPIRSVHITNYYHESSGGVKSNYDRLLKAANRHERYVSLIVPGEEDRLEKVGDFGKIYYVAAKPAPFFDRRYRLMMPWHFLNHGTPIRKILLAERPQMIEIYDNYALTYLAGMTRMGLFARLGRPMFVYFTGERFDTIFKSFVANGRFGTWFSRRLMGNYNLPMFDFYIANSPYVAEELFESVGTERNPRRSERFFNFCWDFFKAVKVPFEDRVAVCPRGVDTEFFTPDRRSVKRRSEICRSAGVPDNAKLVLSSTRLSPEKNVELLPEMFEELVRTSDVDFRFLVAGDGPRSEWLRQQAERKFPGKMVLVGHLDKDDLADHYANVDVFVHPNPREPFGNVGLEAMASGAALVVPNSGGVLTYANETNAWTVEPNAVSFAAAIVEAVTNPELRSTKVAGAIETARQNNDELAMGRLLQTYDCMYEEFTQNPAFLHARQRQSSTLKLDYDLDSERLD